MRILYHHGTWINIIFQEWETILTPSSSETIFYEEFKVLLTDLVCIISSLFPSNSSKAFC